MPKLCNLARMTTATTGTGTITLGVAVSGYLTFAGAGVANNDVVFYGIKDGAGSEVGWGTYTGSGTTLTRNVVKSTNANAAISLSGSAEVYITALAADGGDLLPGFDHPMRGFDLPVNLQLNASVASNVLTVAVKGNNGSDPGNSNPVLVPFRDSTAANGGPVWRAITGALSLSTSVGAHLGASAANQAFRLWILAFDNAGTVALALWQSVTGGAAPTAIAPLNEAAPANTTAMSSSATAAGVFYSASALTGKTFRILGYLDFSSGQSTPGSYANAPTAVQLFGPGIGKPGAVVQHVLALNSAASSTTSTSFGTGNPDTNAPAVSITLTSAANMVHAVAAGVVTITNSSTTDAEIRIHRGPSGSVNTAVGTYGGTNAGAGAGNLDTMAIVEAFDAPGTTTTQVYTPRLKNIVGSATTSFGGGNMTVPAAYIRAEELMV